jgi:3-phenylpropionate/cinnamic acid dioxygenase small subunit
MGAEAAIAALVYRYAELIDLGDLEGVSHLFAHATYRSDGGGAYRGAAAVLEVMRRVVILYDGRPRTQHVTSNLSIDVDAATGTATARSRFTVFQATAQLPLQAIVAGRYHDRFECAAGTWRFADRLIFMDLVGDLRHHLRQLRQD